MDSDKCDTPVTIKSKRQIGVDLHSTPETRAPKRFRDREVQTPTRTDPASDDNLESTRGYACNTYQACPAAVALETISQQAFTDLLTSATKACGQKLLTSRTPTARVMNNIKSPEELQRIQQQGAAVITLLWHENQSALGTGNLRTLGHAVLLWHCFIHMKLSSSTSWPVTALIDESPDSAKLPGRADLIPVACFLLACKINTSFAPELKSLLEICAVAGIFQDGHCSRHVVLATVELLRHAEHAVLSAFEWDILMASFTDRMEYLLLHLDKRFSLSRTCDSPMRPSKTFTYACLCSQTADLPSSRYSDALDKVE